MTTETTLLVARLPSPIGAMLVVHDDEGRLRALEFEDREARLRQLLRLHYGERRSDLRAAPAPAATRDRLAAYFAGEIAAIDKVAVATNGTDFQRRIWAELRRIPAGATTSYGALARVVGNPTASRAVGAANGANPVSIVVPCHRVIGANASLTGYGGGIERKRWLLEHERRHA